MLQIYDRARKVFGIKCGFVEEQIEEIYPFLKNIYTIPNLDLFSPEYFKIIAKKLELERAYNLLKKPFSHYLVNGNLPVVEEQMLEEISKTIYNYRKHDKPVDKHFIAKIVEIMVSVKGLHQYIEDIEFHRYNRKYLALCDDRTLKIYESSIKEDVDHFILEHNHYSYYNVVKILRHEIEHANQEKMVEEKDDSLEAQLLKICFAIFPRYNEHFEYFFNLPLPIFLVWNMITTLYSKRDLKKYAKNWDYAPQERIAEIRANALVLALLEQEKQNIRSIQEIFESDMLFSLLQGYDKPLGPTNFYFSELGVSEKWNRIKNLSSLNFEEKLLFGLPLTAEELQEVSQNKEKILSKLKKMC